MTYGERLTEALSHSGKTVRGLAAALGVSVQAIYALRRGDSIAASAENNAKAAKYLGCDPSWLATGRGSPSWSTSTPPQFEGRLTPRATEAFIMPPQITQERLMNIEGELPELFRVEMPDDALSDTTPRGTELIMERTTHSAPGRVVLVRDGSGQGHIRRFGQAADGAWRAIASNPAFRTLESTADNLTLIAELRWINGQNH